MEYRWQKRRRKKNKTTFHLETLDYVILILIFIMWFLTLRVFFIFQTIQAPCIEAWFGAGEAISSNPFTILNKISLSLLGVWSLLFLSRGINKKHSVQFYIWQSLTGLMICLLFFAAYMVIPKTALTPPDGFMYTHSYTTDT